MLDKEDLKAIGELMDQKLHPINQRLDRIEESLEEIRDSTNTLIEWTERASSTLELPLPRVADIKKAQ